MKKTLRITTALFFTILASEASALSLKEALEHTLKTNPTLAAQQQVVEQARQAVKSARAGFLPSLDATADFAKERQESGTTTSNSDPRTYALTLSQPLFNGLGTKSAYEASQNRLEGSEAVLVNQQQQTILAAATAYMNVLRDLKVLELNRFQVEVLSKQLEATNSRFSLGEVTKTDVSQAEARLAAARASMISAEGQLTTSRAVFSQVIGLQADGLAWPLIVPETPQSWQAVEADILREHPQIVSSMANLSAAEDDINVTRGDFMPDLTASAALRRREGIGSFSGTGADEIDEQVIGLNLSVPLFRGGDTVARYRSAKARRNQIEETLNDSKRVVRSELIDAYNAYQTVRAQLKSLEEAVGANQLALRGVENEATVGTRTVLDVLDARQELLQTQVDLTAASTNVVINAFRLMAAIGRLTPDALADMLPNLPREAITPPEETDSEE